MVKYEKNLEEYTKFRITYRNHWIYEIINSKVILSEIESLGSISEKGKLLSEKISKLRRMKNLNSDQNNKLERQKNIFDLLFLNERQFYEQKDTKTNLNNYLTNISQNAKTIITNIIGYNRNNEFISSYLNRSFDEIDKKKELFSKNIDINKVEEIHYDFKLIYKIYKILIIPVLDEVIPTLIERKKEYLNDYKDIQKFEWKSKFETKIEKDKIVKNGNKFDDGLSSGVDKEHIQGDGNKETRQSNQEKQNEESIVIDKIREIFKNGLSDNMLEQFRKENLKDWKYLTIKYFENKPNEILLNSQKYSPEELGFKSKNQGKTSILFLELTKIIKLIYLFRKNKLSECGLFSINKTIQENPIKGRLKKINQILKKKIGLETRPFGVKHKFYRTDIKIKVYEDDTLYKNIGYSNKKADNDDFKDWDMEKHAQQESDGDSWDD